jgi:hypothetical protein
LQQQLDSADKSIRLLNEQLAMRQKQDHHSEEQADLRAKLEQQLNQETKCLLEATERIKELERSLSEKDKECEVGIVKVKTELLQKQMDERASLQKTIDQLSAKLASVDAEQLS